MKFMFPVRSARPTSQHLGNSKTPLLADWSALLWFPLALMFWTGCSPSQDKPAPSQGATKDSGTAITVAEAREVSADKTLPVVGTLFAKDEATLSAEVEGKVEATYVEFGDRVKENQILAQIDTAAYEAAARQAEANLARARAEAINADASLNRIRNLSREKIAPASELDQAEAMAAQSQAQVKAAEAGIAIANLNLSKSRVTAPYPSAIAERIANTGDFVKVGTPLFRIVNDSVLKLIVQAPERHAGEVQRGQVVRFSVDAHPNRTFEGRVFLISPSVNTSSRAFSFGVLVTNTTQTLKANTFARGELILAEKVPTLVIPLEAVVQFSGSTRVFLYDAAAGKAVVRPVELGRVLSGQQEVLSGLKPGEKVILTGQQRLIDGSKVRLREGGASNP